MRAMPNIFNIHMPRIERHACYQSTLCHLYTYRGTLVNYTDMKIIEPRSFLSPEEIRSIRKAFPGSTGAQVLLTGWLLIMFAEKKAMEACWGKGTPDEIGALRVGYTLASFQGTAETIESARGVSDKPETFAQQAAIGLRFRLPGGLEAIMTVSHAFIRLVDPRMSVEMDHEKHR